MRQINLSQKILDIRGKPIRTTISNPEYEALSEKERLTTKIPQTIEKEAVIRDYFLTILGQRFEIIDKKEYFWTTELGSLIASETKIVEEKGKKKEVPNEIIEISEDKAKFLKRIIEKNKVKQILPTGEEKEIEVFFPYELGQLLKIFEE